MSKKIYLYPFIFCTILSQGIFGTLLEDDIEESSNVLVREKRVINRIPSEDVPTTIENFPYVVKIRKNNRVICAGTILSHLTVITAARCVDSNELQLYSVGAGSPYTYLGIFHRIIEVRFHGHHPPRSHTFMSGIALTTVHPPIEYNNCIGSIGLHPGPVLTGMQATVVGWGTYYFRGTTQTEHPRKLRKIDVPIINHRECVNIYGNFFNITEEDVCTYHEHKQCGVTDAGAPLIIDNLLVGVYLGAVSIIMRNYHMKPDVFALVQHHEYSQWIRTNIR